MIWLNYIKFLELFLNKVVVAVMVFLIGFIIAKLLSRLVERILKEAEINRFVSSFFHGVALDSAIARLVEYVVYIITIIITVDRLGLTSAFIYAIALGLFVVFVLSFVLGLKDFLPNFFAGISIIRKKKFRKGQNVLVNGIDGVVDKIDLQEVIIISKSGDKIFVPNSYVLKNKLIVKK